jgi:peroxin-2
MTSSSFAQAQERLDARRRARETAAQASLPRSTSSSFGRLPFPLSNLGRASLSTWERIKGREGTGPAFRVGQVDAELLDEELLEMLRGQIGEGLKYFGVRNDTLLEMTGIDHFLDSS